MNMNKYTTYRGMSFRLSRKRTLLPCIIVLITALLIISFTYQVPADSEGITTKVTVTNSDQYFKQSNNNNTHSSGTVQYTLSLRTNDGRAWTTNVDKETYAQYAKGDSFEVQIFATHNIWGFTIGNPTPKIVFPNGHTNNYNAS